MKKVPAHCLCLFKGSFVKATRLLAAQSLLFGLFCLLLPTFARADLTPMTGAAVAPNIAEISISEDGVSVALEIFVGDMRQFEDLLPDDWVPQGDGPRKAAVERLAHFAERGLSIRTGTGKTLPVTINRIEPRERLDRAPPNAGKIDPITGRKFPKPPDDPRVVYVELFYDFEDVKPDRLELIPPLDDAGLPYLTIGMVVFDREVPVTDFRYLSAAERMTLAWEDPWYTKFDNPNLRRHHRYPVMTFIYAEPYEIRHEAVMRVREAAALTGVELQGVFLSDDERLAISESLPGLVKERSPMTVDGVPVSPDLDRMAYLRIGPAGLVYLENGEKIRTDAALIGLIYSVPTEKLADEASVEWTLFAPGSERVPAQTIDAAGPFISELTPQDPVLVWTNYFKQLPYPEIREIAAENAPQRTGLLVALAIIAVGLVGVFLLSLLMPNRVSRPLGLIAVVAAVLCGTALPVLRKVQASAVPNISEEQLTALTTDMLNNIYRAFDFKLEDQVYDRLALTLTGDVLEQVYLDQRAALRVERAGGAQARVDIVEITKAQKLPSGNSATLRLAVEWRISGIVGHWGHDHRRNNSYAAEMAIRPIEGAWKINEFHILSQERRQ